ncbi:MAG TPA: hypothetical protein VMV18_01095, partial [bacterium]|nr:hypothetical protein [bacterium]
MRRPRTLLAAATLAGAALLGGRAARAVDLQQWKPAPGEEDLLAVQSPRLGQPYAWHLLFAANYADRPFRLVRIGSNRTVANVISHQTSLDLGGAWTWRNLVEVGAVLPITLNQTVGAAGALDPGLPSSVPHTALGDLRLVAKAPIAEVAGTTFAAGLPLSLPTARGDSFLGHEGLTARPRLLVGRPLGRAFLVADAGLALRAAETFRNFDQATAIDVGLGASLPIPVQHQDLTAILTAGGEWGLAQNGPEEKPLEV